MPINKCNIELHINKNIFDYDSHHIGFHVFMPMKRSHIAYGVTCRFSFVEESGYLFTLLTLEKTCVIILFRCETCNCVHEQHIHR
jgi:hypothetical protein